MDTYRATNTLNGKFYIGSSVNFEKRKYQHLHSKETYPFQTDLRKNPEAFVWEVYTDNLDTNEHEAKLLKEFFFDVRCYNLNSCAERPPGIKGRTGWKNELIQKQIMCFEKPEGEGWEKGRLQKTVDKTSGENNYNYGRTGEECPMFGVPKTEEAKKKQSETVSGEKNHRFGITGALHPRSKAIIAIKPDGTKLHFGSVCEAARELKRSSGCLFRDLKSGHVLTRDGFKGWQFLYENP